MTPSLTPSTRSTQQAAVMCLPHLHHSVPNPIDFPSLCSTQLDPRLGPLHFSSRPPTLLPCCPASRCCERTVNHVVSQYSPTSRSDPTSSIPARLYLPTTQPDEVTQQASLLSLRLLFFRIHSSSCLLVSPQTQAAVEFQF
ncbi:hypothetical protein BLNAU_7473 [Blattamonas nauphoetae]|uniref:Uncharacterized protein n=1 Tax=Blattamonas nauphoetae TaxID=2049346 RepID=A0ABQ9Y1K7_9EUKA|nr:hypothetical protein BLNAU_7473 [Blattamonas nauphoetae]